MNNIQKTLVDLIGKLGLSPLKSWRTSLFGLLAVGTYIYMNRGALSEQEWLMVAFVSLQSLAQRDGKSSSQNEGIR